VVKHVYSIMILHYKMLLWIYSESKKLLWPLGRQSL
jgi:hypothetical protein